MFGASVSDLQSDITIDGDMIKGTLKYFDTPGEIVDFWGEGYFIVLNMYDNDYTGLTSVMVGLDPSVSSGLQELINDPQKNGIFKITNKDTQKFVIVQTDGTHTTKQEYRLNLLTETNE